MSNSPHPQNTVPFNYPQQVILLIRRLLICYLFYFLSRLLFYLVNISYFGKDAFGFLSDAFHGLRFDSFSIVLSNSLFIVLSLMPPQMLIKKWYRKLLFAVFIVPNSLFILFDFIDTAYFPFIRKRSTADIFEQIGGQSDIGELLPRFISDYWWLVVIYAGVILLMTGLYRISEKNVILTAAGRWRPGKLGVPLILLCCLFLSVLALRGGLQQAPIDIVNAGAVTKAERVAVVLNTPFTIIKSMGEQHLRHYDFYKEEEISDIYNTIHHFPLAQPNHQNLVVLVLESFSKEYTSLGRKKSFTPFLDSLMQHGLTFTNAFSNSSKSIEGIPAILSGIPSYMDNPFINSVYANNKQSSFASLLKEEGYKSAFFHGGRNGSMNFTEWAATAGYAAYYGMDEYADGKDFDGFWGIWDEPFLQFCAQQINTFPEPFHAALFTLSSHHPYLIPEKHRNRFRNSDNEIEASLRYADYSLSRFFQSASKMPWYHNTLFVLVADHAAISVERFRRNPLANLTIPVVFYKPDNSLAGTYSGVFSQVDILPEALRLLGYNKRFFAFGKDPETTRHHLCLYYSDGVYQVFTDSMLYNFNGEELIGGYNYVRDTTLTRNVLGKYPDLELQVNKRFKAVLQTYNRVLISDAAHVESR